VPDDRPVIEVEHQMTVRNQMNRTRAPARHWEQTGLSSGYCLCGWTAGNGQLMPNDLVVTHAAQHLREAVTATMKPQPSSA
jgi:hypothetical protein